MNNLASLTHKVQWLLTDAVRLEQMRAAALRCARPRAAWDVAGGGKSRGPAVPSMMPFEIAYGDFVTYTKSGISAT